MRNDQIHFRTLLSIFIISVYTILLFLLQAITRSLHKKVSSTLQLPCPSFLRGGFLFLSFSFIIES